MITRFEIDNERETRYVYHDTNTDCVYVGSRDMSGNTFTAFTAAEWKVIIGAFADVGVKD